MTDLEFDDLRWLLLLWAVLGVAAAGVYGLWQRRRALRLFAAPHLLVRLAPPLGWSRPLLRLGLVVAALVALVAGLVGPRWGEQEEQIARRNIDVLVLLDVSRSMLARDIAPNRLERAKLAIRDDLLPALGGDRIGLITFAGAPTLACPLTDDYGFFRLALADISIRSTPRGGTLIGDAIRKAADSFPPQLDTHKVIILITDGEDHESFPVRAAADLWQERRIPIVPVALGDEREGARVPVEGERGETYLQYKGAEVWTRANFEDLRQIAAFSDVNAFVPAGTRNFDLGAVYRQVIVPKIEHREQLETRRVPRPARGHLFAAAALLLVLLDSLLPDYPRRAGAAAARRVEGRAA